MAVDNFTRMILPELNSAIIVAHRTDLTLWFNTLGTDGTIGASWVSMPYPAGGRTVSKIANFTDPTGAFFIIAVCTDGTTWVLMGYPFTSWTQNTNLP